MRINELSDLNLKEFNPFSKRSRQLRKANIAGQKDLKATADNLGNEFASYLGTKGINLKQAGYSDLADFFTKKGVDSSNIDTTLPFNQKRLDQIFVAKSKEAMQGNVKPVSQEKVSSAYTQTKNTALKLNAKEKRRLIQQLEKSIKTKPAKKAGVVDKNFDKSQKLSDYGKVGK